jgi:hypothetical protein
MAHEIATAGISKELSLESLVNAVKCGGGNIITEAFENSMLASALPELCVYMIPLCLCGENISEFPVDLAVAAQ